MNPWLLAGLVFGVIGLLQSATDAREKENQAPRLEKKPAEKSTGKAPRSPVSVVVNSGGQGTAAKPTAKVPSKPKGSKSETEAQE